MTAKKKTKKGEKLGVADQSDDGCGGVYNSSVSVIAEADDADQINEDTGGQVIVGHISGHLEDGRNLLDDRNQSQVACKVSEDEMLVDEEAVANHKEQMDCEAVQSSTELKIWNVI